MELMLILFAIFLIVLIIVAFGLGFYQPTKKVEHLEQYWYVEIGMSEDEMLEIMGKGFNRSLLKDNRVKYEWRINAQSYGSSYKGMSYRSYSGVKKVTIYLKNGFVEEVRPYNV